MKLHHLKPIRVCIALAFFLPTVFLFLDLWNTGVRSVAREVLFLQFVPSMLKFLNHAAIGAAGFLVILILTLLFGRVYCSTVCPLGTVQDLISRVSRRKPASRGKQQKRRRFSFSRPNTMLRHTIFSLTLMMFLAGSGLLLNLFDPFSSFGRLLSNLLRPVVIAMNNLGAHLAEGVGNHTLYRMQWPAVAPVSVGVALITLFLVVWLASRHGRLYCNTLCPVGTLLGLVSKVSLFRISIDKDTCKGCGLCEAVCKAGCIDLTRARIDTSRCVACCNCLSVCPEQAVTIRTGWKSDRRDQPEHGRRDFILAAATAAGFNRLLGPRTAAGQTGPPAQSLPTTIPEQRTSPLSPPGSESIMRFTSTCTACHLCVAACPSRVLVPSFFSYGLAGMMQPRMDFQSGHCNYDCTACTQVCPSGAIRPLSKEMKQRTQVGVAKFIRENCVVFTDKTNCGACSEHCPTKAVHMVPYLNSAGRKLVIPKVNETICVGCGGCEHACPTKPYKAIYVDGNPIHKTAEKPVEEAVDQKTDTEKEFPF